MRATNIKATRQVVGDYENLLVNRRAYTMQSLRPHPESGRHYYFRPSSRGTDIPVLLTADTIRRHLEGEITIGLYAINPSTQRCKWVAIDADYRNAMEDLLKLQYHLSQDSVQPALEMSKRGGHLWVFLATPLLARECRTYVHDLAQRLGVPVKGAGLGRASRYFPNMMQSVQEILATRFVVHWEFIEGPTGVSGSMVGARLYNVRTAP